MMFSQKLYVPEFREEFFMDTDIFAVRTRRVRRENRGNQWEI